MVWWEMVRGDAQEVGGVKNSRGREKSGAKHSELGGGGGGSDIAPGTELGLGLDWPCSPCLLCHSGT